MASFYLRILAIIISIVLVFPFSAAKADLSSDDKQQIEQMIESYIQNHPEILRDVLTKLARDEHEAQLKAALALVYADSGDPVMGNIDGELTIYEFSDYNCGYCKRLFPELQAILKEDQNIKLVVKEFPILSETSVDAARAAIAAQKQGKFPDFHVAMMNWRGRVDENAINHAAKTAQLDIEQMRADMLDPQTDMILERTRQSAIALEIKGTPALIIGTQLIPGAISKDEILNLIKLVRADKNS